MKKKTIKILISIILSLLFLVGIIYSSYRIITWKSNVDENQKIEDKIEEKIKVIEPTINDKKSNIKYEVDFKYLKSINSDTVAYIRFNGLDISYIVVKGNDNEFYLKHNFDKKYNIAGWIFGDHRNKFDGNDINIVIYGHNTKDGSMFGNLKNILNKDWQESKDKHELVLVIDNVNYYYEVFSTYTIEPEEYYISTDFKDIDFETFIKKLKSRSVYDYKVSVSDKDKVLTLSSCIGDGTKRVVLHAKLIKTVE